ncbi:hypothetical protein NUACC26_015650 [Scytonema sp. NUACC26]
MAVELKPHNIPSVSIWPGIVATEHISHLASEMDETNAIDQKNSLFRERYNSDKKNRLTLKPCRDAINRVSTSAKLLRKIFNRVVLICYGRSRSSAFCCCGLKEYEVLVEGFSSRKREFL